MEDENKVEVLTEQPKENTEEKKEEVPEWLKKLLTIESLKEIGEIYIGGKKEVRKTSIWHYLYSFACLFAIVGAVVWLSYTDTMTPTAGVILGSLAGYLFGRNTI